MLKSYLTVAFRNLVRYKGFSVINILGLSLGMAACLTILLWVRFEFSYNRFHENLDDLYLVASVLQFGPRAQAGVQTLPMIATALREEYPEVVDAARTRYGGQYILKHGKTEFRETVRQVDASFFRIFTYPFVAGDPSNAYEGPYSVVLSETTARKYFGDQDPLGKVIRFDYRCDLTVTGVMADMPANSNHHYDVMIPFEFWVKEYDRPNMLTTWYNSSFTTAVQLRPGVDWEAFSDKIADRAKQSNPESNVTFFLFPWRKVHLYSVHGFGGRIATVIFISWLALIILLIACFNFMNLATARASGRAREVGVRKVVGAGRKQLIGQFYLESMIQSFLALVLALVMVEQFLPYFRELIGEEVRLDYLRDPWVPLGALAVAFLTGLVAGSYPALLLSSFKPANVLRGALAAGTRGVRLRRALVVIQFTATVVLFVFATSLYQRFENLNQLDVGFDRENVLYFRMSDQLKPDYDPMKAALLENPDVLAVTRANSPLSGIYTNGSGWDWEGKDPEENPLVTYLRTDLDFLEVYGIEMAEGRFFTETDRGRGGSDVIINETWARMMGDGSPIGKTLRRADEEYRIIGVVRDFRYKPVSVRIGPLLMAIDHPQANNNVFVKIREENAGDTLAFIEGVYHRFMPDRLFEYTFLEDEFDTMYTRVQAMGDIIRSFAVLAALISCLGLFGLASFVTERRAKEIGIRKVLGASIASVTLLLTREFVILVVLANLIALPVSVFLTLDMSGVFPSVIGLSFTTFLLTMLVSLALASLTVGVRTVQAALANPVDAIRHE